MPAQRLEPDVEESQAGGGGDIHMSEAGTSRYLEPVVQPITAKDLVAVITEVLQAQQAQQPPPPPTPLPQPVVVRTPTSIITEFCKLSPPTFTGEGDPILAEKWEEQIIKQLDALEVQDDATRIRLATFQFRDAAETWWRSMKDTRDVSKMKWKKFSRLFMERFFPLVYQEQKRKEFIELLQRSMTVTEYETQFTALSQFAGELVADER